jgi:hypothetical protein
MLATARALGCQAIILEARSGFDIDTAFATLVERAQALQSPQRQEGRRRHIGSQRGENSTVRSDIGKRQHSLYVSMRVASPQ